MEYEELEKMVGETPLKDKVAAIGSLLLMHRQTDTFMQEFASSDEFEAKYGNIEEETADLSVRIVKDGIDYTEKKLKEEFDNNEVLQQALGERADEIRDAYTGFVSSFTRVTAVGQGFADYIRHRINDMDEDDLEGDQLPVAVGQIAEDYVGLLGGGAEVETAVAALSVKFLELTRPSYW